MHLADRLSWSFPSSEIDQQQRVYTVTSVSLQVEWHFHSDLVSIQYDDVYTVKRSAMLSDDLYDVLEKFTLLYDNEEEKWSYEGIRVCLQQ